MPSQPDTFDIDVPYEPPWMGRFDDRPVPDMAAIATSSVRASPFIWRDPASIPRREWLYGKHYIRQFASATAAQSGVGKSTLTMTEALALASGRPLLGVVPEETVAVWIWNGEDPLDELERRLAAIAIHYGLSPEDIGGRLFVDSGRSTKIKIATQARTGTQIAVPLVDSLVETISANRIGAVIIDPFVSSHSVSENDNTAIEAVVSAWADIAHRADCAVELVHHTRKALPGEEMTIDHARGAGALIAKSRAARVLNPMSEQEATRFGVEERRLHFRVSDGKASMSPPSDKAEWFRMASVNLGNGHLGYGDDVGVVTRWTPPDLLAGLTVDDLLKAQKEIAKGRWRENIQAKDWVGKAVAAALGLDLDTASDKAKVKSMLAMWIKSGALVIVQDKDDKGNARPFIEVGEWANE
jgi:hypothetical protein